MAVCALLGGVLNGSSAVRNATTVVAVCALLGGYPLAFKEERQPFIYRHYQLLCRLESYLFHCDSPVRSIFQFIESDWRQNAVYGLL